MAYLQSDKVIKEGGLVINQKLTPDGYAKKPNKKMAIKAITVHNTGMISTNAATNPAEQYARATYPNANMGYVAVHYWVYKNIIWQQLRDDEQGWHAGSTLRKNKRGVTIGGNQNNISIECISADPESEETTKKLVALLCKRHGFSPLLDVYTHNFWMYGVEKTLPGVRKNCPIYILDHWATFLKDVDTLMDKGYYELGDTGEAVKTLQGNLVELGYKLDVDGSYGPGTEAIVKQFQTDNALLVDGIAGPKTLELVVKLVEFVRNPPVVQTLAPEGKLYRVQVGAFGVKENADALAAELVAKGFKPYVKLEDK